MAGNKDTSAALVKFNFHGDELDVATVDGEHYAVLAPLCEPFKIGPDEQVKKLKKLGWAQTLKITVWENQLRRELFCLNLRSIAGWLFTINAGKVRPELREKLAVYQRECADVLADHFLGKRGAQALASGERLTTDLVHLRSRTDEILVTVRGQQPATVEGLAMALRPIIDQAIVDATTSLAGRLGEMGRQLVELRAHNDVLATAIVRLHDLGVDTSKRIVDMAGRDGRISSEDADRLRAQIEILTLMHLRLGKEKKKGSEKSAKSGIISTLFEVINWGGAGKNIGNILARDVPIAKNHLDYEIKKARREQAEFGRVVAADIAKKKQKSLFDDKPN